MTGGLRPTKTKSQTQASGSRTTVKKLSIRRPVRSVGSPCTTTMLSATKNVTGPTTRPTSSQTSKKKN